MHHLDSPRIPVGELAIELLGQQFGREHLHPMLVEFVEGGIGFVADGVQNVDMPPVCVLTVDVAQYAHLAQLLAAAPLLGVFAALAGGKRQFVALADEQDDRLGFRDAVEHACERGRHRASEAHFRLHLYGKHKQAVVSLLAGIAQCRIQCDAVGLLLESAVVNLGHKPSARHQIQRRVSSFRQPVGTQPAGVDGLRRPFGITDAELVKHG